jgi:hypothetical protein
LLLIDPKRILKPFFNMKILLSNQLEIRR